MDGRTVASCDGCGRLAADVVVLVPGELQTDAGGRDGTAGCMADDERCRWRRKSDGGLAVGIGRPDG